MQHHDQNFSAQLDLDFYTSDWLGLQWSPTRARALAPLT
jgi:hypothetical protein